MSETKPVEPIKMPPYTFQTPETGSFDTFAARYTAKEPNEKLKALMREGKAMTHIDPMETFAEVPRMLPTFSARHGLRMSYVDSAGKQRCLVLKPADLTRIMHSAAVALETVTRDLTPSPP